MSACTIRWHRHQTSWRLRVLDSSLGACRPPRWGHPSLYLCSCVGFAKTECCLYSLLYEEFPRSMVITICLMILCINLQIYSINFYTLKTHHRFRWNFVSPGVPWLITRTFILAKSVRQFICLSLVAHSHTF
jgi:hypothetical protein